MKLSRFAVAAVVTALCALVFFLWQGPAVSIDEVLSRSGGAVETSKQSTSAATSSTSAAQGAGNSTGSAAGNVEALAMATSSNRFYASLSKASSLWSAMEAYAESNDPKAVTTAARIFSHCFLFDSKEGFDSWYEESVAPIGTYGFSAELTSKLEAARKGALRKEFNRCAALNDSEKRAASRLGEAYKAGPAKQLSNLSAESRKGVVSSETLARIGLLPIPDNALIYPIAESLTRNISIAEAKNETDGVLLAFWASGSLACSLGDECGAGSLLAARLCLETAVCGETDSLSALHSELIRRGYRTATLEEEIRSLRERLLKR
jgi:hypothetical protein